MPIIRFCTVSTVILLV